MCEGNIKMERGIIILVCVDCGSVDADCDKCLDCCGHQNENMVSINFGKFLD